MTHYLPRIEQFDGPPPTSPLPEIIDGRCLYGEAAGGQAPRACRLPDGHDGDHDLAPEATTEEPTP